ncbi:MAG: WG repeat-containing protein, partial [Sphingobacteriales bacterium]|nr:WG repeat-containing protein [Sphingobacteriales bacterium]
VGVIDTTGKFIVPFGKYETIKPFFEGFSSVEINDKRNKDGSTDGVIDTKGNLLFKRPYKNNSYVDGNFYDGFAKVSLYKYWIPEKNGVISTSDKSYEGFINLKGEVIFNDTNYRYVNDFANGRAFIKENGKDYVLVDKNFKRVGNKEFQDIPAETFKNGYAIVETDDGFGIIDTLGNLVTKPDYGEIDRVGIVDGYFFFSDENDENKILFG